MRRLDQERWITSPWVQSTAFWPTMTCTSSHAPLDVGVLGESVSGLDAGSGERGQGLHGLGAAVV